MTAKKRYIGDGVYADVENGQLILTTENGISVTNLIFIEPEVWSALLEFVESLKTKGEVPS